MKLHRTLLATLLVALLALATLGPAAAVSANVEVFATGLVYPRGLEFGPGGLYVAEAGPGGEVVTPGTCPGYTSPFEPYHSALTARPPWPPAAATCTSATWGRSPSSAAPRSSFGSTGTAGASGWWPPA